MPGARGARGATRRCTLCYPALYIASSAAFRLACMRIIASSICCFALTASCAQA